MIRHSIPAALAMAALGLFGLTRSAAAADNTVIQTGCCSAVHSGCCDDGCRKVCRPTVEPKDVAKRVYSSDCEDFCLPKCPLLGKLFGGSDCCCADAACHDCGKPRMRKYLVVHIRHHEECVPKCQVEYCCPTPCCPTPCCPAPVVGAPPAPGTILPAPGAPAPAPAKPMPAAPAAAPKAVYYQVPPSQPVTVRPNW
jgi:hypothetical protein